MFDLIEEGRRLLERLQEVTFDVDKYQISVSSAKTASNIIDKCLDQLEKDSLPDKTRRLPELTRLVIDEWPLGSELGKEITFWEDAYRRF